MIIITILTLIIIRNQQHERHPEDSGQDGPHGHRGDLMYIHIYIYIYNRSHAYIYIYIYIYFIYYIIIIILYIYIYSIL